jgi:NADPH-dependent stearoyl-CoA 9-desaturase
VRALIEKRGLEYNTGRLGRQLLSVGRQLAIFGRKPSDPYRVGKSPESRALRRAKREEQARRAEAEEAARMSA